ARAGQIRDGVTAMSGATVADMLALQLDDRALFLQRWRDLLLRALTPEALEADPRRRRLREVVEDWGERAAIDSIGYRMVRGFRIYIARQVLGAITAACTEADSRFSIWELRQYEGPLWKLVTELSGRTSPAWMARHGAPATRRASSILSAAPSRPSAAGSTCPPSLCPATPTCRSPSAHPTAPPSAWSSRRATSRRGCSTCHAARAATPSPPTTATPTPPGPKAPPPPSSPAPPNTP
ncbi:MAG: penicillin acylase family protein, partial [Deltaproteobacteria bacterium]|nr:penicillin acylase family protein [Deltaproteobacteria bacterium]